MSASLNFRFSNFTFRGIFRVVEDCRSPLEKGKVIRNRFLGPVFLSFLMLRVQLECLECDFLLVCSCAV